MKSRSRALSLILTCAALVACEQRDRVHRTAPDDVPTAQTAQRFDKQSDNTQVQAAATIVSILPDDNDGSRHQRFIVRLGSGQTILIAHNVDIAPRINALRKGDDVSFSGIYEWNPKGGVVHWTHHDPSNRHKAGWIRHNGQLIQ